MLVVKFAKYVLKVQASRLKSPHFTLGCVIGPRKPSSDSRSAWLMQQSTKKGVLYKDTAFQVHQPFCRQNHGNSPNEPLVINLAITTFCWFLGTSFSANKLMTPWMFEVWPGAQPGPLRHELREITLWTTFLLGASYGNGSIWISRTPRKKTWKNDSWGSFCCLKSPLTRSPYPELFEDRPAGCKYMKDSVKLSHFQFDHKERWEVPGWLAG